MKKHVLFLLLALNAPVVQKPVSFAFTTVGERQILPAPFVAEARPWLLGKAHWLLPGLGAMQLNFDVTFVLFD